MGKMLKRRNFEAVEELPVGETVSIGPLTIRATYADHNGARFRHGPQADTLGFIIEGGHSVYFPGDTDLFPDMATLSDNLDVALMPVWGWGPSLGAGHLNPRRAALALQMLKPRLAIPIHWGTLFPFGLKWLFPQILMDPPSSFARYAARLAPDVEVSVLQPGQSISLKSPSE